MQCPTLCKQSRESKEVRTAGRGDFLEEGGGVLSEGAGESQAGKKGQRTPHRPMEAHLPAPAAPLHYLGFRVRVEGLPNTLASAVECISCHLSWACTCMKTVPAQPGTHLLSGIQTGEAGILQGFRF